MHVIAADKLHKLVFDICIAAGADGRNASCLADHQVRSNLRGVDTHGIWHLPLYVDQILAEQLLPANWPEVIRETAVSALVDGNWTFGQTTAMVATEIAVEKALGQGMAAVGTVRCNHIGRVGHFVEMAAAKGCVGIVVAGGFSEILPVAAPFGGRERVLSTNPVAMGFPAGEGRGSGDVRLRDHGDIGGEGFEREPPRGAAAPRVHGRPGGQADHRSPGLRGRGRPAAVRRAQGVRA